MDNTNRIYDAVYGYIELNDIEFDLVNSPIFQRLHWIKQLGPLHIIFPSAQHSRFSHSIGVFHIMRKMIKHLETGKNGYKGSLSPDDWEALKLAALLHDIGHVPLSHIGESVLKNSFVPEKEDKTEIVGDKLRTWKNLFSEEYVGDAAKLHELLSVEIVLKSQEIKRIVKKHIPETDRRREICESIAKIIVGKHEKQICNALLHSELDADRLDYLLRDSFFTGVGYGRVDLDYIISRICPTEDSDGITQLCFENKGLHTIEHYILGRFFLHTQVIFNRKVRFLDLAFEDVMKYMIDPKAGTFHIMNLQELLEFIRCKDNEKISDSWHKLYMYTDAEIFAKMRGLHGVLDKKEKDSKASDEEKYINDCIKIIMDGNVRGPVGGTSQILVPISSLDDREYVKQLKKESKKIAENLATDNAIYKNRIVPNISEQSVMKYTEIEEEEESLKEAVRITNPTSEGKMEVAYAAKSRATILGGLIDKKLLVFNVYYVQSKSESEKDVAHREAVIAAGFKEFVSKHFLQSKMPCGCDTGEHLCQAVLDENRLEELKKQVKTSNFICSSCGRTSLLSENLCKPVVIES
jgi:HD superfamily phosphohydrolase